MLNCKLLRFVPNAGFMNVRQNTPGSEGELTLTADDLEKLFKNLVWPAVAGNVAWAFFSVLITEPWSSGMLARLATLMFMARYLFYSWLLPVPPQVGRLYYAMDGLFAIAVVSFAIATQDRARALSVWVDAVLLAIFAVAACGHWFGVWEPGSSSHRRQLFGGINAIGILILLIGICIRSKVPEIGGPEVLWFRAVAIWFVVGLWRAVVRYLAAQRVQRGAR
jgi:hypothetical protein